MPDAATQARYDSWAAALDAEQLAARVRLLPGGHQTSYARRALRAEAAKRLRDLADALERPRPDRTIYADAARAVYDGDPEWLWTNFDGSIDWARYPDHPRRAEAL